MPMDQYSVFVGLLPQIERVLVKKGEKVPRPQYGGEIQTEGGDMTDEESEVDEGSGVQKKSNIEATSDEEED